MVTVIVSDLHLGSRSCLLDRRDVLGALLNGLVQAQQVVLLGDLISLREGPVSEVLGTAWPFLEELGEALRGRRVVIVPGNHDHELARPLLEGRRLAGARTPLEAQAPVEPDRANLLGCIAHRLSGAEVVVAYPGVWLRPDVYVTHGHYLDCHLTVPRLESVLASVMKRLSGGMPNGALTPDDYEAALAPMYGFAYAHAQSVRAEEQLAEGLGSRVWRNVRARGWDSLQGGHRRRRPRSKFLDGALLAGGVAAMNLSGLGPFRSDISRAELSRAGLRAMREVVERLGIGAEHVIFGHTHRAGPFGDEPGWTLPSGTRLQNTGSWVYSRTLVGEAGQRSPYWPGTSGWVADTGAPVLRSLLDDVTVGFA